ncbi:DUF4150 domain-containing protein [Pseudoalteromonas tunicata]|jgi:hypothetical protein|uniref:Uncharacterized protein n=1 Tax=Pseudoalteromonas tunicata D2 TaxID=87626 RepID=A4C4F2_9GAMM|nr:DUF4150 domain-containing protein [Pseudoalteromonas tunicata]ATC97082.1 hypothetical protein PTUN_b0739 [Pseudoalteromonas tunicata]AXT33198.1 DUF4150 domain-containing protein [Pseudoalteromonas tunicata]EAR30434.1 hypothetical protein PTD2_02656 [Pseudoalteromonas tunicata D2]MDP4984285.1 DUF4150 domain-containing protein [Pseudoalteromonas tunicata]
MFAKTQMGGMDFAFPDVCLTPIPSPVGPIPTPIPYPNIAIPMMAIPSQFKVLTMCMPNHNLMTITPMSNGDNAGLFMNPLSGMVMGPQRNLFGSVKTLIGGLPATKMLSPSGQNGVSPGAFGMSLAPSQIKLLIMA